MSNIQLQSVDISLDMNTLSDDELYDIAVLAIEKMSDSSMTRVAEEIGGNHFKPEQVIALVDSLTAEERLAVLTHFAEQEAGAAVETIEEEEEVLDEEEDEVRED